MKHILFVAVDVDEKSFHAAGLSNDGKVQFEYTCKPTAGAFLSKLKKYAPAGYQIKICYEATYLGFSLYRDLVSKDCKCDVVASTLIPGMTGNRVKNDRLDARKLVGYYSKGLLTPVHVPNRDDEQVRDLIRSRAFLVEQKSALKIHILSICRRMGWNYRQEVKAEKASFWTEPHKQWLNSKVSQAEVTLKTNLSVLLSTLRQLEEQIQFYDENIQTISEGGKFKPNVSALICYRGIDVIRAMTLVCELGDIRRFKHPRNLVSYAGMDITEYSSGGKEFRFKMTKMGNKQIRTTVIEACQQATSIPKLSYKLKHKRKSIDPVFISIADRCMHRLHKKATRMLFAGKHRNKIKAACGRELLGFIWESLLQVKAAA
jgi:transposase